MKGIKNVELYDSYFKRNDEFLIEYMVDFSNGRAAVKLIASENPIDSVKINTSSSYIMP